MVDSYRKTLVLIFGALSVFFAWVAVLREVGEAAPTISVKDLPETVSWHSKIGEQAAREDRLILFIIGDSVPIPDDNPSILALLRKRFIVADMEPAAYPGDYAVLQKIFEAGGAKGALTAAILTPKLTPIAMTSRSRSSTTPNSFPVKMAVYNSLNIYTKNRSQIYRNTYLILDKINSRSHSDMFSRNMLLTAPILLSKIAQDPLDYVRALNMAKNGGDLAILSESARTLFRMHRYGDQFWELRGMSLQAAETLLSRYSDNPPCDCIKPLVAISVAEAALCHIGPGFGESALKISDEILETFDPSRGLFFEHESYPIAQNALAVSALCYAYRISRNSRYMKTADACLQNLRDIFANNAHLPALAFRMSQASSKEYAFLARAFLDFYAVSGDNAALENSQKVLAKMTRLYSSTSHFSLYDNSTQSGLSSFARTFDVADGKELPSSTGIAAQVFADLGRIKKSREYSERTRKILAENLALKPLENVFKPSIKLAALPNPILADAFRE